MGSDNKVDKKSEGVVGAALAGQVAYKLRPDQLRPNLRLVPEFPQAANDDVERGRLLDRLRPLLPSPKWAGGFLGAAAFLLPSNLFLKGTEQNWENHNVLFRNLNRFSFSERALIDLMASSFPDAREKLERAISHQEFRPLQEIIEEAKKRPDFSHLEQEALLRWHQMMANGEAVSFSSLLWNLARQYRGSAQFLFANAPAMAMNGGKRGTITEGQGIPPEKDKEKDLPVSLSQALTAYGKVEEQIMLGNQYRVNKVPPKTAQLIAAAVVIRTNGDFEWAWSLTIGLLAVYDAMVGHIKAKGQGDKADAIAWAVLLWSKVNLPEASILAGNFLSDSMWWTLRNGRLLGVPPNRIQIASVAFVAEDGIEAALERADRLLTAADALWTVTGNYRRGGVESSMYDLDALLDSYDLMVRYVEGKGRQGIAKIIVRRACFANGMIWDLVHDETMRGDFMKFLDKTLSHYDEVIEYVKAKGRADLAEEIAQAVLKRYGDYMGYLQPLEAADRMLEGSYPLIGKGN